MTTIVSGKVAEDSELDEEIRMLAHGNYDSYYRVIEEKQLVEVLFVFNGSRDIQALMTQLQNSAFRVLTNQWNQIEDCKMATHLTEIKGGGRTYYISHSGDTVYYSTECRGKGSTSIRGLKFRDNQIIDTSTNKPVGSDYEILKKMGK